MESLPFYRLKQIQSCGNQRSQARTEFFARKNPPSPMPDRVHLPRICSKYPPIDQLYRKGRGQRQADRRQSRIDRAREFIERNDPETRVDTSQSRWIRFDVTILKPQTRGDLRRAHSVRTRSRFQEGNADSQILYEKAHGKRDGSAFRRTRSRGAKEG